MHKDELKLIIARIGYQGQKEFAKALKIDSRTVNNYKIIPKTTTQILKLMKLARDKGATFEEIQEVLKDV